jgi:TetR/AcrR family transcriptional repressor of nem operon
MRTATLEFPSPTTQRGRPREFDMDEALDKAIPVLCERGFHGTSINDLADAMQLTVGSIYKAYEDKRGVFMAALDRQSSLREIQLRKQVEAVQSGREKLRAALLFYVGLSHGIEGIQGCLIISTAVDLMTFDPEIAGRAGDLFKRREKYLAGLLRLGQADGSISKDIDEDGTARMMLCLLQGLRVVGKTGRSKKELLTVVAAAMKTLD